MKKAYAKPQIAFENFLMSTSIAAICEYTNPEQLYIPGLGNMFTEKEACTYIPDMFGGDGGANGICYQTFENGVSLHNS